MVNETNTAIGRCYANPHGGGHLMRTSGSYTECAYCEGSEASIYKSERDKYKAEVLVNRALASDEVIADNRALRARVEQLLDERAKDDAAAVAFASGEAVKIRDLAAEVDRLRAKVWEIASPDHIYNKVIGLEADLEVSKQVNERLTEALKDFDRMSLVIESAVRNQQGNGYGNHLMVVNAIQSSRAALCTGG